MFFRLFILFLLMTIVASAQTSSLKKEIQTIIHGKKATIGVGLCLNGQTVLTINNKHHYAMMSTFKFPLAISVLNYLDKQKLPLTTEVFIHKSDLLPNTYSPLRDSHPDGNFNMSVKDLIKYSVSLSDNNACDILLRYLGGPQTVQDYLDSIGIKDMHIVVTEARMHEGSPNEYLNWCTPEAAVQLTDIFLQGTLLSEEYQKFLETTLIETTTGADKLKGQLPSELIVGHKTGSSDRSSSGLKAGDNDMGFVRLPNGKSYSIAVFIMDSLEDDKTNAAIIARISRAVFNHLVKQ